MNKFTRLIILVILCPLLGAASLRPYSDYPSMTPDERYNDLKLRFILVDYTTLGAYDKQVKYIRDEINSLRKNLDEDKKKVLDLILIHLLMEDRRLDEAEKKLENFSNDNLYFIKSRYFLLKGIIAKNKNDLERAAAFFKQALEFSKSLETLRPFLELSLAEIGLGNNDKAITYIDKAFKDIGNHQAGVAELSLTLGQAYFQKGDTALALDNYFKALEIYKKAGDDYKIVNALNNIAIIKGQLGKVDEEIQYFKQSEKYFSDAVSPKIKTLILGNIFRYYTIEKDYINSEIYYKKALKIARENNFNENIIYINCVFAKLEISRDRVREGIKILDSLKSVPEQYWNIFFKYLYEGAYSSAYLKLNKLKKAEIHFLKTETFVDKIKRSDVSDDHLSYGIKLYKKMGDIKKEYEYYKRWRELKEKVEKEKSKKLLYARENESLALNNQLYAEENKNLALKNEQAELILENQKTRLFMLSGFVIAILVIVALQFNRNKIIKRKNIALETKEKLIREKTNDLQAILDNIVQGVVTIELKDEGNRKLKDISRHFFKIFANLSPDSFANSDPIEILFQGTSLSAEDLAKINSVIVSSTGEPIWHWEMNKSNLPMEMIILDGSKIIEIDWVVVLDQEEVSKLIITFKDVTEIRGLGEKQRQNEINVQKLISLSLMDQKEYFILMSSVEKLIKESIEVISENSNYFKEDIDLVFRNLHTIKGLARTYDLMLLSAFAHQIEDYFQDIRSKNIEYKQFESLERLGAMKEEIDTYSTLAKTKLKWDQELSTVPLSVKVLTKWYQKISDVNEGHKLDLLLKEIKNKYSTSLKDALQNIIMSSQKLSKELNKGEVIFSLNGCDIFVTEKMQGHLSSIFVHLIRNSIDHGFLEISEREKQNIAPPEISIDVETGDDHHVIYMSDNGKGINLDILRKKALESNIDIDLSDEINIAGLIFESGFSTKDEISAISGRGVGMDAVSKYLEALGGRIELLAKGESANGFLPVIFKIQVPQVFFEV